MRLRGIPGDTSVAQAAHVPASIAARKAGRHAAAPLPPPAIGKAGGEACNGGAEHPPRPGGKAA